MFKQKLIQKSDEKSLRKYKNFISQFQQMTLISTSKKIKRKKKIKGVKTKIFNPEPLLSHIKFYRLINNYFATSCNDPNNYNFGYNPLFENNAFYVKKAYRDLSYEKSTK